MYPDFVSTIRTALKFSHNLILFLPKNTSIQELIDALIPFAAEFNDDAEGEGRNELKLEVEQIIYGESCKGIHVYTGEMVQFD